MKNYRIVIKCKAGFLTIVDKKAESPLAALNYFHPKAVLTIEEQTDLEHGTYFTVFALKGSSVTIASTDIYKTNYIQNYHPKTDMKRISKPVTEYDHVNKSYSHA